MSPAVTRRMRRNRKCDTTPETRLRSALHAAGLRFRTHYPIRTAVAGIVRPDAVFTRRRIAVFVDGCFWHVCPIHGNLPTHNPGYWAWKLTRNVVRDRLVDQALSEEGWTVVRIWEHDDPAHACERVRHAAGDRNLRTDEKLGSAHA